MNKYKLTIADMLTGKPSTLFSFGNTPEEAIKCALLRINEITLEQEKVLSIELATEEPEPWAQTLGWYDEIRK